MPLTILHESLWEALAGAAQPAHPFHFGVLTSTSERGPEARTVVVRDAVRAQRQILIYSDRRSAKIAQLRADPRVVLVVQDTQQQLRVRAVTHLHLDDALSAACWERCSRSSRRAYLTQPVPGSRCEHASSGLPTGLDGRLPTAAESAAGRAHFAVLRLAVNEIDWLALYADGHRRARFSYAGDAVEGHWCVP